MKHNAARVICRDSEMPFPPILNSVQAISRQANRLKSGIMPRRLIIELMQSSHSNTFPSERQNGIMICNHHVSLSFSSVVIHRRPASLCLSQTADLTCREPKHSFQAVLKNPPVRKANTATCLAAKRLKCQIVAYSDKLQSQRNSHSFPY